MVAERRGENAQPYYSPGQGLQDVVLVQEQPEDLRRCGRYAQRRCCSQQQRPDEEYRFLHQ